MTTEILEIPQSSFLRRLVETGRAKLPLAGDVLIFDPGFWKNPLTWKVPFVKGYIPTMSLVFISISGIISTTLEASVGANMMISIIKMKEAMMSIPANPSAIEPRLVFIGLVATIFGGISIASLYTAYKYFGLSRADLEKKPLPFGELVKIFQDIPGLDQLPEGSLLKMIFSGCACWNFINKVRKRERARK